MNYNDILSRIQKGESVDAIAKEFTDNLNKAQAEVRAAEEAKKANDAKSKKLDEIAATMANAVNEYAKVAGITIEEVKVEPAEVREMLDSFLPLFEQFKDVKVHIAKVAPKVKSKTKSADETITSWLNSFGW